MHIFFGYSNPSSTFTDSETAADLNPSNVKSVTVKAKWTLISWVATYDYKNSAQTFTAPETGYYSVQLWGAVGGQWSNSPYAGKGAYTYGKVKIDKDTVLYIHTGGLGSTANASNRNVGGYNGGGYSHKNDAGATCMAGGGGATDIRTNSGTWNDANGLRSRIMVAAGGGGGGYSALGTGGCSGTISAHMIGSAGGTTTSGSSSCSGTCAAEWKATTGATQTSGGYQTNANYNSSEFIGVFGYAPQTYGTKDWWGPGGGGGWYGGGSGGGVGGSGGSSYISGHTGAVAVASTTSSTPKSGCTTDTTNNACSISPYGYTFMSTQMIAGDASMPNTAGTGNETGHSGNGYAKITWLGDTI